MTGPRQGATLVAVALLTLSVSSPLTTLGHSPDPIVGGEYWAQNQIVQWHWRGTVPPDWARSAIHAAADDSNDTRASKAAIFDYDASGDSHVGYGEPTGCGVNGIACFTRGGAPRSFTVNFRRHGHVFDWGTLRWCQAYADPPNGCYDMETIGLDEFGHVQILGHHDNFSDDSDYLDAVVQTYSRTRPRTGWNEHAYGRCDVATLQRKYDVWHSTTRYSTCLDVDSALSLRASDTSLSYAGNVTFSATLRVVNLASYERLAGNYVSERRVLLQRRFLGGSWSTVATMAANPSAAGAYRSTVSVSGDSDWRAVFPTPSNEGINGDTSGTLRVSIDGCSGICPSDEGATP